MLRMYLTVEVPSKVVSACIFYSRAVQLFHNLFLLSVILVLPPFHNIRLPSIAHIHIDVNES